MTINAKTLTNANSILRIRCPGLYDQFVEIRGFQADNRTTSSTMTIAETVDGVDGETSGGYVYNGVDFEVYLMPNSASIDVFRNIMRLFIENKDIVVVDFEQVNTALGRQSEFSAFFVSGPGMSGGAKLFAGETYTFRISPTVEDNI